MAWYDSILNTFNPAKLQGQAQGQAQGQGTIASALPNLIGGVYSGATSAYNTLKNYKAPTQPVSTRASDIQNILKQLASIGAGGGEPQVYIPSFDINKTYGQAKQKAASVVNPYYQKELRDFLNRQNVMKKRATESYDIQIGQYEKSLKDYLEGTGIEKARTEQDVATQLGQMTTEEQARQEVEAQQFDIGKRGIQEQLGQTGMTFSGLGRQQLTGVAGQRRMTEQAQQRDIAQRQERLNLMKGRTLDDLSRGERLKGEEIGEGKKLSKISLNQGLEDILYEIQEKKKDMELQRQAKIFEETQRQRQLLWQNYFAKLSTAQKEKAAKTYGGMF